MTLFGVVAIIVSILLAVLVARGQAPLPMWKVLERPTSFQVRDVTLEDAILALADKADINVIYDADALAEVAQHRVSVNSQEMKEPTLYGCLEYLSFRDLRYWRYNWNKLFYWYLDYNRILFL